MKQRTKRFALDAIEITAQLPKTPEGRIVGKQLIRCSTSVGANYRAACRAKSKADFIAKLLSEKAVVTNLKEANEITAFIVASRKTAGGLL